MDRSELPEGWSLISNERHPVDGEWETWSVTFLGAGVVTVVTVARDGEVVEFAVTSLDTTPYRRLLSLDTEPNHTERPPGSTGRAITARLLRSIPFGELAAATRALPSVSYTPTDEEGLVDVITRWEQVSVPRPGGRPGPKPRTDLYLAELAVAYRLWQGTGLELSDLAKRAHLSVAGLRTALRDARDRGFLTEAPRGRKGGEPTEKTYRTLERESAFLKVEGKPWPHAKDEER